MRDYHEAICLQANSRRQLKQGFEAYAPSCVDDKRLRALGKRIHGSRHQKFGTRKRTIFWKPTY